MDRLTRLERLARWYAEAFHALDQVERHLDEVLRSVGLMPAEDKGTLPAQPTS